MRRKRLHLDWETFSELDIKKVGAYAYAMHPSTELLLGSYAIQDGKVRQWDATKTKEMPKMLRKQLEDPNVLIYAFNAPFERLILKYVLGIDIPIERFRCTMVMAYGRSFSGNMAAVGEQIGLPSDKQKLKTGNDLIRKFCQIQPANRKVARWTRHNAPEEWEHFKEYNIQDTVTEREIFYFLEKYDLRPEEWKTWFLDQKINDLGLPIDVEFLNAALALKDQATVDLMNELRKLTKVANPNSKAQMLAWLQDNGCDIDNMQAPTIEEALQEVPKRNKKLKKVLTLYQFLSKSSVSKFEALKRAVCPDGRLRGAFQYMGASRTARWAGRLFQPQNLPRPERGMETDHVAEDILTMSYEELTKKYGNYTVVKKGKKITYSWHVMQLLVSTIRSSVRVGKNKKMTVSDLAGIEGRVLPWLCFFDEKLLKITNGMDMYKVAAEGIYHVSYDAVDEYQRFAGKVAELALGYQGAVGALNSMGKNYGVEFDDNTAKGIVRGWRQANAPIVKFWKEMETAARAAILNPGYEYDAGRITFYCETDWLFMVLPNGRELSYFKPEYDYNNGLTYMGLNTYTRKWERSHTYGGKLVENGTQAVARDVMTEGMHKADEVGFGLIGTVHDEILSENKNYKKYGLDALNKILATQPAWAAGLPLAAAGYEGYRYKKD